MAFCLNLLSTLADKGKEAKPKLPTAPLPSQSTYERSKMAGLIAGAYSLRATTNFFSSGLAEAYTIGMIQMFGIFVMAGLFDIFFSPFAIAINNFHCAMVSWSSFRVGTPCVSYRFKSQIDFHSLLTPCSSFLVGSFRVSLRFESQYDTKCFFLIQVWQR